MPIPTTFVTVSIPYVNAPPHVGYALELVQADAYARHRRSRSADVCFQAGTDDNSLKNVLAAEAKGVATAELVAENAAAFEGLRSGLDLSWDDFIRTSSDPRHRPGVEALWRKCAAAGDFYRRHYEGPYCVGCEQFYAPDELDGGCCPEHGAPPEVIAEENWFFRLSKYGPAIERLIESGELRIEPPVYRNEVLAFLRSGLRDLSVSRSAERARGWGIPVPGDPDQVVYVWWDALGNYVTALGYATDRERYRRWWVDAAERIHVIGKGVVRFHAVYWPALLLSAREPLPTAIFVHPYLTAEGRKLSKSAGGAPSPRDLADRFGVDALRWWLLREVPRNVDADFTEDRLVAAHDRDLANGVGNLVARTVSLVHRLRGGRVPACDVIDARGASLLATVEERVGQAAAAVDAFDFRVACDALVDAAGETNRYLEDVRPWEAARAERGSDREKADAAARAVDAALAASVGAARSIAAALAPLIPSGSARLAAQLHGDVLARPSPPFPRLASLHERHGS